MFEKSKYMIKLITVIFFLIVTSVLAADLPRLTDTEFFTKTALGCQDVNIQTWSHPTKQVLIERGIKLKKVSLCNNKKLPVFYAEIPYDPHFAHNNNYLHPLYYSLLRANGWWPFAIVATSDNTIIFIKGNKKSLSENLEDYSP
ncbi:MAG: hypothetical protein AB7S65_06680 [Sulfuricurvum sp.]